ERHRVKDVADVLAKLLRFLHSDDDPRHAFEAQAIANGGLVEDRIHLRWSDAAREAEAALEPTEGLHRHDADAELARFREHLLLESVDVPVDEVHRDHHHVHLPGLEHAQELRRTVVSRDADEARLALLLHAADIAPRAVLAERDVEIAIAGRVEMEDVDRVDLEQAKRLLERLLRVGRAVRHALRDEEDLVPLRGNDAPEGLLRVAVDPR